MSQVPSLGLMSPAVLELNHRKTESGYGHGSSMIITSSVEIKGHHQSQQPQQNPRKQRRCWSPDLHRRFVDALQQLGGPQGRLELAFINIIKRDKWMIPFFCKLVWLPNSWHYLHNQRWMNFSFFFILFSLFWFQILPSRIGKSGVLFLIGLFAAVATPKQIRELMQVVGLTNDEVKSHLQVRVYLDCLDKFHLKYLVFYIKNLNKKNNWNEFSFFP